MKILIPNVTGPTNIGDHAIASVLLHLLDSSISKKKIVIHTKNPELYEKNYPYELSPSVYQHIAMDSNNPVVSLYRLIKLFVYLFALRIGIFAFSGIRKSDILLKIVEDFRNSDLIIFSGGGYLRSQGGIKQSLNLLLQVLPFAIAKLYESDVIVAPISFGPFAYRWQAQLVAGVLNGCDVVSAREIQSYKAMQRLGIKNLILSNDLALLIKKSKPVDTKKNKKREVVVGFTIRNWLRDKSKQIKLEQAYVHALTRLSEKTGVVIQPIIQVQSPDFPFEDDARAVNRVCIELQETNAPVRDTIRIRSIDHAAHVYSRLDLLLGMRMHSNILAAIQGVPFAAISYEHKTEGIASQIDMKKYCINCEQVDNKNLYDLLINVYKRRNYLKNKLIKSIDNIRADDMQKWSNYLSKYQSFTV